MYNIFYISHPLYADQLQKNATDVCVTCHRKEVESFFLTPHAKDYRCDICHGDASRHLKEEEKRGNIVNPAYLNIKRGNNICIGCHEMIEKDVRDKLRAKANLHYYLRCFECHIVHLDSQVQELTLFRIDLSTECARCHNRQAEDFYDSSHGLAEINCFDCHKLHQLKTISEDIEEQIERCLFCHPDQELEFKYPYTHPLRERQIKCSDCHNPHSNRFDKMLKREQEDICSDCHADIAIEAGRHPKSRNTNHPFKTVGCLDCHKPHGSNFDRLLKHNIESICKTCHN
jgi:predicted CXXCH cytochrome family protein